MHKNLKVVHLFVQFVSFIQNFNMYLLFSGWTWKRNRKEHMKTNTGKVQMFSAISPYYELFFHKERKTEKNKIGGIFYKYLNYMLA